MATMIFIKPFEGVAHDSPFCNFLQMLLRKTSALIQLEITAVCTLYCIWSACGVGMISRADDKFAQIACSSHLPALATLAWDRDGSPCITKQRLPDLSKAKDQGKPNTL